MARESLGGRAWPRSLAAVAVAIAPIALLEARSVTYSAFIICGWVMIAGADDPLLKSD